MSWAKAKFESLYAEPSKNGLTRPARVRGAGYKMINMGELFAHDRIGNIPMELVPMNEKELSTMLVEAGDLLFARQSLVLAGAGKCSIIHDVVEPTTFESHIIRVRLKRDIADPHFYYYYFRSPQCGIRSIVTQGVQAGIRGNDLKQLPVHVPPIAKQAKIAAILSAYDDLIENNRRRIQLLEQAARLLYKEWFVHLRFPGHEHVTITDGVPEGWHTKSLGDLAELTLGKMLDQRKNRGEQKPYLANVNIRWGKITLESLREMRFEQREAQKYDLRLGDILMCEGGEPGRCAIWKDQVPGMMFQKALHRIRAIQDIDYRFLYHSLFQKAKSGKLAALFTGATIKHLPREKLAKVELLVPPQSLIRSFGERVEPIEDQISVLETTERQASKARDLLLPRLMNGEIAV